MSLFFYLLGRAGSKTKRNDEQSEDKLFFEVSNQDEQSKDNPKIDRTGKKWIVMMNEPWRVKWDLFVIVLAIWNSISVPFDLAFKPLILQHPALQAINWVIDALFVVDIVINFRTSFINNLNGEEVTEAKEIAA